MRYLVFIFLLFSSIASYAQELVEPNDRVSSKLRIRDAPHSSAPIVGYLAKSQRLPLLSKDVSYYYEIERPNGLPGYVSKSYSRVVSSLTLSRADLKISFIDVGQGDSTLINCPDGKHILIDAGSLSGVGADYIREQILGTLDPDNVQIDSLIITHPDQDHYNRLRDVIGDIPVSDIYWVGSSQDYNISFWKWFDEELTSNKIRLQGDDFNTPDNPSAEIDCGDAEIYILAANVEATISTKNAKSIVVMVRYGDFEAILTGDATHATENVILDRYDDAWLDIDLLKIGHHGSLSTSTSIEWAQTLSPELAVVSAGNKNRHGHPRREVIQRLEPYTIQMPGHEFVSATGKRGDYKWHFIEQYMEAIYSTVTNGMIFGY